MSRKARKRKARERRLKWLLGQARRSKYAEKCISQGRHPSTGEPIEKGIDSPTENG